MKRLIIFSVALMLSLVAFGQNTIKFLGIPIDGTKKEMIEALVDKGYVYYSFGERIEGVFNGEKVSISVQTVNNDKVWRLVIRDVESRDLTEIGIRFNNLLSQFENNNKYILQSGDRLSDRDLFLYDMREHDKQYEVCMVMSDKTINGRVWYTIERRGGYRIAMFYENLDNAANGEDL